MPETFGRYVIERKLGQGGMGAVYLAVDPALNRRVALKVITSDDQEMLERFQREAQAVAKLKHPNIVQVYEAGVVPLPSAAGGSARNQHYFTMDYIDGNSLDKYIYGNNDFNLERIVRAIMDMALALDYAHRQGIIHRDIKPGNIMIDTSGKVYLADFGLAKSLTGLDRALTMTGMTIGTPEYMSPEQVMGRKEELDQRSDIFSLGATFYHCITGRMPFDGKEVYEVFSRIINNDPSRPSTIVRIIPNDLEIICLKCIEKDKARRYQTAKELADDLGRYLNNEPILATRSSYLGKLWRRARKNKAASLGVASAAIIALAVIIGLVISSGQARVRSKAKLLLDRAASALTAEEKIQIALDALKIDPTFGDAYQAIGYVYEQKAQYETAYEYFSKAITATPTLVYSYYERATIMSEAFKRPKEAIADFEKVLQLDPNSHIGYFAKGNIALDQKKYDEAIACYSRALELYPRHLYSYVNRGITYTGKGELDKALADLNEAIRIDPDYDRAYFNRGIVFGMRNDFEPAIADYSRAIKVSPSFAAPYLNRGNIYKQLNELEKAFADYTVALKINPQFTEAYYNRADIFFKKDKHDEAIADYNAAIQCEPDYAKAHYGRGGVYLKKGGLESALRDYTEAIKLDAGYVDAYYNRGVIYGQQGKPDDALADYNAVLKLKPDYADAYNNRAVIYLYAFPDKAIADCEQAIKLKPDYAEAFANLGNVYNFQGQPDKAIAEYTRAIKLNPDLAEAYHGRAMMHAQQKNYAAAIADSQQFLKLQPKSPLAIGITMLISVWQMNLKDKQNPPLQDKPEESEPKEK